MITCPAAYNLFPQYGWLATVLFAASFPPLLLVAYRSHWRPPRTFYWVSFSIIFLVVDLIGIDVSHYWQIYRDLDRDGAVSKEELRKLPLELSNAYYWKKLRPTGAIVLGCSALLTLLAWGIIKWRLIRSNTPVRGKEILAIHSPDNQHQVEAAD